jgi:isopentenyl diphosphate isomerase/L-lactate dehydrogenase-like FMN-dependent dehydrogenase
MSSTSRINNVADARRLARRILPRAVFDYIDGGAEDEVTMAENERAFREVAFRPRMATRADAPDLTTTVLGTEISLPLLLAPCGLAQLMHPDGALGAARAAKRIGTVSVLSTVAGTPPEGLAHEPGPRWFQLYAADRRIATALIGRAASSGFEGLVVTVDTPALGKRERDARNGWAGSSLKLDLRTMARLGPQVAVRPRWTMRMLSRTLTTLRQPASPTPVPDPQDRSAASGPSPTDPGAVGPAAPSRVSEDAPTKAVASAGAVAMLASPFAWDDIAWMRERWTGSLLVKGVLSGDDAVHAADAGADAVIVSNHGGRQLEGAPATLRVLPEVVEAAGNRLEVLLDGGVRRGGDVAKAVALGARAVLIGRPYLYALAAAGEAGVERMLEIFRTELSRTLTLMGCHSVSDLDRTWLQGLGGPD